MTLLVVLQNYNSLSTNTPRDVSASWLGRFTLVSFLFNIAIFAEQILVHFGLQAQQWLDAQRAYVNSVQKWDRVLYQQRHRVDDLFREWDSNCDGRVSKKEFLRGIKKLAPATPIAEARSRRPAPRPPQTRSIAHTRTAMTEFLRLNPHQVYKVFDTYDVDGSGSIEITELKRLLEDVTAREERASGRQKEERTRPPSSGLVPKEQYMDGVETATQYTSPPPSPPSAEAQAVTAKWTTANVTPNASPDNSFSQERQSTRRSRSSSKEFFEGARRSSSNETVRVKRELAKVSQELLDQSQMWRLKTYYVFPVLEKMRHLDHISRFVFPTVYTIYLLAMLSEVNFGVDQRKLLESNSCYNRQ